jgi:DNA-directed RNA polymerase subunit beta
LTVIKKIIDIHNKKEEIDDVDSLSNRRIRSVGEMVANQFQIGLSRIEKAIKDILGSPDVNLKTPKDLLNSKPINSAINEFFVSGQMAQFMDQTNPLSEITHKRRVTVLGPGGLSRDRAGFEVRDVHPTYYGRLCPIETPEGPNIGLISSLAGFTRIDKYGYLTSPYYVVKKGVVTDEIVYCSVFDEENKSIVQKIHLNEDRKMPAGSIGARLNNEFITIDSSKVDYMAVSSRQIVSVATSLIPFLEHNDANRALMGANMQRQAIPVLKAEKPISGTGVERVVALGTGSVVVSKTEGTVINVSSNRIVIQNYNADILKSGNEEEVGIFIYNLIKYSKSNQNTCINQRALVKIGDKVRKGDVIADGSSTQDGDLALGKNIRIAFMSWNGYNFEDAIIISDKLVKEEAFTSIHIESFVCTARVTKQGDEEITTDIPNIKNHALDDSGIVRIGEFVESGGILVGKITPKGATQMNPEEKLLRAIFGEKASDVRDSSLRMPRSMSGRVIDVQVQTRSNVNMERENLIKKEKLSQIKSDKNEELKTVTNLYNLLRELISSCVSPKDKKEIGDISSIKDSDLLKIEVSNKEVTSLQKKISSVKREIENKYKNKTRVLEKLGKVAPGVIAIVKVFVAVKRRIQPGDKMAGRHGNKGVISIIVPEADMPFDENGVPVDMILNPLGVPSRMNIGQILEVHLGMASYGLGLKINSFLKQNEEVKLKQIIGDIYGDKIGGLPVKSLNSDDLKTISKRLVEKGVPFEIPVFDGCDESDVKQILKLAGMPESGRIELFDGHTGNKFDFPVTVGYMYILKLNHLVDDKMHARSTGSYSLVTQQPLSGKAQFGGQRVGEMEVWAFEAYGAAHLLQEILTSKSDDIEGRKKMYKNIVVGENNLSFSTPESFNVLMQEIRALGLNINTEK